MAGDHKCPVCQATFTRPQHVSRHMRSHTGDRPYKCQHCGDQFARSDLLSRHVNKCHGGAKASPSSAGGPTRRKGHAASRATTSKQACDQCVQSSLPCDGSNPCAKCIQRKCRCTFVKFHRQTAPRGPGHGTTKKTVPGPPLSHPHPPPSSMGMNYSYPSQQFPPPHYDLIPSNVIPIPPPPPMSSASSHSSASSSYPGSFTFPGEFGYEGYSNKYRELRRGSQSSIGSANSRWWEGAGGGGGGSLQEQYTIQQQQHHQFQQHMGGSPTSSSSSPDLAQYQQFQQRPGTAGSDYSSRPSTSSSQSFPIHDHPNATTATSSRPSTSGGEFSNAFGMLSIDDPAVLAGLANDGQPFFSHMDMLGPFEGQQPPFEEFGRRPSTGHGHEDHGYGRVAFDAAGSRDRPSTGHGHGHVFNHEQEHQRPSTSHHVEGQAYPLPVTREEKTRELREFWNTYNSQQSHPLGLPNSDQHHPHDSHLKRVASLPSVKTPTLEHQVDGFYTSSGAAVHPHPSLANEPWEDETPRPGMPSAGICEGFGEAIIERRNKGPEMNLLPPRMRNRCDEGASPPSVDGGPTPPSLGASPASLGLDLAPGSSPASIPLAAADAPPPALMSSLVPPQALTESTLATSTSPSFASIPPPPWTGTTSTLLELQPSMSTEDRSRRPSFKRLPSQQLESGRVWKAPRHEDVYVT